MIAPNKIVQERQSPHSKRKWALAGIVCVVLAGCAWYFLSMRAGNVEHGTTDKPNRSAKIVEVAPSLATPVKKEEPKPEPPKADPNARPTKVGEVVNKYVMLPNGKIHYRRGIRKEERGGIDRSHPAAIFDHQTDNEFAVILTLNPGESLIGGPLLHGNNYEKAFLESLKNPIIVSKDDPEDVQSLKRAVIETRLELKKAIDNGEDIKKIVEESYAEAQRLSMYKESLRDEIRKAAEDQEMSDQDLDDMIKAANIMLESKGIAPMKFGILTRARLRNLKK